MRFTVCVLCFEEVARFNTKDGICFNCWKKIENGESPIFTKYQQLDVFLEVFPKSHQIKIRNERKKKENEMVI